jgi:similar to stage IV sporulation protein
MIPVPNLWKGKIHLALRGAHVAALINEATAEGFVLENLYWVDERTLRLTVLLPQFRHFVRFARKRGIRLRIVKKEGVPFITAKILKRKSFFFGFLFFFVLVFVLSSFVWKVEIEGTERIPVAHVRELLKKEGVYEGQLKFRLPSKSDVQHRLMMSLPQASWVSLRVEGTRVSVTVVEKKIPDPVRSEIPDAGPVHLVAKKDAVIYDLMVERGHPVVEVNDVVKKGQLLVSGVYGDPNQPETGKVVGAKGKVWGEVWYESDIAVPLEQKRKEFTGARQKTTYPFLSSLELKNPFGKKITFSQMETVKKMHSLYLGKWRLPLGWVEEENLEMKQVQERLSVPEAARIGTLQARDELLRHIGKDGRILEEKVLHQRVESGKVYLKVHFDAIENIALSQPILQGE